MAKKVLPVKENPLLLKNKELEKSFSQEAIEKGVAYDPQEIAERDPLELQTYKGLQAFYPQKKASDFDPYEDYIAPKILKGGQVSIEDLNEMRARNQNNWEQAGHAIGRVAVNIVPQILGGVSSMLDIPGYWDAEHAANNAIVNWAQELKKEVDNDWFPIYEEDHKGGVGLDDWAWWMSRGSGLVESIGSFVAQGWGMGKALSVGGQALGKALQGKKLVNLIGADKLNRGIQGTSGLLNAVALNQSEAVIEATQVFKDTYDYHINKGKNHAEAKKAAAIAASSTMNINRINILTNLSSASAFIKPFKYSRQLVSAPSVAKSVGRVVLEGAQESGEELINLVASKAGLAHGRGEEYTKEQMMKDIGSVEGFEAAFLGALGGMAQTGATTALDYTKFGPKSSVDSQGNKISFVESQRRKYQEQQQVIEELKSKGVKVTDALYNLQEHELYKQKLRAAEEKGDQAEYDRLQEEQLAFLAAKHFKAGTTEVLIDMYKAEAQRDVNEVGQEYIDNANKAIKSIEELEKVYNNFEGYVNVQDIYMNKVNQIRNSKDLLHAESLEKDARIKRDEAVKEIAKKYEFEKEQEIITKKEGKEVGRETKKSSYPMPYYTYDLANNTGDTETNRAIYDKFLEEVSQHPAVKEHEFYEEQRNTAKEISEKLQTQFKEMTSKEGQEKAAKDLERKETISKSKSQLPQMNSITEIEKLKEELKDNAFNTLADKRIQEIKQAKIVEANDRKFEVTKKDFADRISKSSGEELEQIKQEIEALEVSSKNKVALQSLLADRVRELNGEEVEDVVDANTALGGTYEDSTTSTVDDEVAALETEIPNDIPNPKTEAEEVETQVGEAAVELLQESSNAILDSKGELSWDFVRTTSGANRAAYQSRLFRQVEHTGKVTREEVTNEVQNKQVLDPDKLVAGTKITLTIDVNYGTREGESGEKYDPNSNTKETILWEKRLAEIIEKYGIENYRQSPEYLEEVPIAVYDSNDVDHFKKPLFYVHDVAWLTQENINTTVEELEKDRALLREIRRQVINLGEVSTTITEKGRGRLMQTADSKPIPVSEAMPDSELTLAVGKDGLPVSTKKAPKLTNKTPLQSGRLYALVPVGPTKEGMHTAIPLQRQPIVTEEEKAIRKELELKLSKTQAPDQIAEIQKQIDDLLGSKITNTVIRAIELYLAGDVTNQTVADIYAATQLNITKLPELRQYLQKFISFVDIKGEEGLEHVLTVKGNKLNSSQVLIRITGNSIEFGKPGVNSAGKNKAIVISKNFKESPEVIEAKLKKLRDFLPTMLSNADLNSLSTKGKASKVSLINPDGSITTTNYSEFVKQTHKTNVLGINIGTEEAPKYVYTIQPTILFDTSFAEKAPKKVIAEPKTETAATTEEEIEETVAEKIDIKIQDQEFTFEDVDDDVDPDLDSYLEGFDEDADFLPPTMTDEQITEFLSRTQNLFIKGLDLRTQQTLIDFLSARVYTEALNNKGTINRFEVYERQKEAFKKLEESLRAKGLENKAKRIKALLLQWNKVMVLTDQHISLFSSGTIANALTEESISEDVSEAGLIRSNYNDDWTFTIDSKNTASADLKKFFSFIQDVDQEGNYKVNAVLGVPEVIPFDEVYNTLHEILANKPADFATMLAYLELNKSRFPWLASVVKQLNSAPDHIKNEFVSDMAKHHIQMNFVMWSKDFDGNYVLQNWSSNSSSIEQRVRASWSSNLKAFGGSNLVVINENDEYKFDSKTIENLEAQAKEWAANPPAADEKGFEALAQWLGNFGIVLSDNTYKDLAAGKFKNKSFLGWKQLFTASSGPVQALMKQLKQNETVLLEDAMILNDTVVKILAKMESRNLNNVFSNSFNAGTKTVYSYGNNNFLVNRMRDLTDIDEEGNFKNTLIEELSQIAFSSKSQWLEDLKTLPEFQDSFKAGYVSLEALKKQFSPSKDNRKLNQLTEAEHEITKIGMFFNTSRVNINGENRRIVNFFYPTMSDKSTMLTIQTLSRYFEQEEGSISENNLRQIYRSTVLPEIMRMTSKKAENVSGYEPNYFYFFPQLNNATIVIADKEVNVRDFVLDGNALNNSAFEEEILKILKESFDELVEDKLQDWANLNIGVNSEEWGTMSFLDKSYMKDIARGLTNTDKVKYAAQDYVFNSLIANAEIHMLFTGDPALYAKFKGKKALAKELKVSEDSITDEQLLAWNLENSYINLGKRLAGDIAPGMELADSQNNKYIQVFFEDTKIDSSNVVSDIQREYFEKIQPNFASNYSGIEGADAQEYTTWQEHLYVMKQLGRLTNAQYETLYAKLDKGEKLSYKDLGLVLQPIKPVYVGNRMEVDNNVERRVYIKSSSFPLIPQLTAGLEIDKIRIALEDFQKDKEKNPTGATVRASFNTANKVGGIENSVIVFDKSGLISPDFKIEVENTLLLERKNFRIQQDVPYDYEKAEINIGTQARKLLFVNMLDVEIEPGITGEQMLEQYNSLYKDLFEYKHNELLKSLGLITTSYLEEVPEFFDVNQENNIFEQLNELETKLQEVKNPIQKKVIEAEFEKNYSAADIKRAEFVNNNFDTIVEELLKAKMNVFFDEKFDKDCE